MKTFCYLCGFVLVTAFLSFGLAGHSAYADRYFTLTDQLEQAQQQLLAQISHSPLTTADEKQAVVRQIRSNRRLLKAVDFWYRYAEPIMYRKLNGPLPVEWETEVFEKFEPPYRREGAGLTLAELYLEEKEFRKDSLEQLVRQSLTAFATYRADSVTRLLRDPQVFYLSNRLFLLNLAAIYTTGFECPDTSRVILELRQMLKDVEPIYETFSASFPDKALTSAYREAYRALIRFCDGQPSDYSLFDHFTFLRNHVNPLFAMNQEMIRTHKVYSSSMVDYSLREEATSLFDKRLYQAQQPYGLYSLVSDDAVKAEIRKVGRLLFYDPLLSGNNERSCASCHRSENYFTDTTVKTALQFNRTQRLDRNTPSLVNVIYNHLLMLDGKHLGLQEQAKAVTTNPLEMGITEDQLLAKVLAVPFYRTAFRKWMKHTPEEKKIGINHILSALTAYYSSFSSFYSPFDEAIEGGQPLSVQARKGFNLFMGKAQCGTCHFPPQFNGVKPPYTGSEFEVIGVPSDTSFTALSADKGRYNVYPHPETLYAFRTPTLRNIAYTAPYMHNGLYRSLDEVIRFYEEGGGAGRGLSLPGQTLSDQPLVLTAQEKEELKAFLLSLSERIIFEPSPSALPASENRKLNKRIPGGTY